ncbi:hypothetical protein, partial [Lysinibacillus sp. D4A1_S13]|uniref:hypothetical protein n=1 Tax=Lysinibacillus sp. D4A1_S13 TaxID=2941228 RepID=UPI0020C15404
PFPDIEHKKRASGSDHSYTRNVENIYYSRKIAFREIPHVVDNNLHKLCENNPQLIHKVWIKRMDWISN